MVESDDATDTDEPAEGELEGRVLDDRYRVEAELGRGAMGVVYRARHVSINRPVAIKVIYPRLLRTPTMLQRFQREAEIAAKLNHPNVCPVLDVGELPDGRRSMVLDLVTGPPLSSLAGAPVPPARVVAIAKQLCDGLDHAHALGLVHRDLKPENIVLETAPDGREVPRIIDFGIAMLRSPDDEDDGQRLTAAGLVMGTPQYMAPEQATDKRLDGRTDLFALGVIMFELLAGKLPFDGTGAEVAYANVVQPFPTIEARGGVRVDPLLEAIVGKLVAKDPAARFATARAARQALDLLAGDRDRLAALLGLPIATPMTRPHVDTAPAPIGRAQTTPPLSPAPARKLTRRDVWIGAVALATVVVLAVIVRREPEARVPTTARVTPPVVTTIEPPPAAAALPRVAEEAEPTAVPTVPMSLAADAPPTPVKPAPAARPVVAPAAPPVVATPELVASRYADVGRLLKEAHARAVPDLEPLLVRYRVIRLHDAIATAASRDAAIATLDELASELAARVR